MYDYREAMADDIKNAIEDNAEFWGLAEMTAEEAVELLTDKLWINDTVTGNGSGSYTFNRESAKECVLDNMELCVEAFKEFCAVEQFAEKIANEDWEFLDVTIRCYLLPEMVESVVNEMWVAA